MTRRAGERALDLVGLAQAKQDQGLEATKAGILDYWEALQPTEAARVPAGDEYAREVTHRGVQARPGQPAMGRFSWTPVVPRGRR